MLRVAIYPGSFDPITNGHIDIIKRSLSLFDRVIIAVNDNPPREFLFTAKERVQMIREVLRSFNRIEVESFQGLLVNYAKGKKANFMIRGLRALSDFEYEFQMYLMNKKLSPEIEILYFMTNQEYFYLSSSIIKEISELGGPIKNFVPERVREKLVEKFKSNSESKRKRG